MSGVDFSTGVSANYLRADSDFDRASESSSGAWCRVLEESAPVDTAHSSKAVSREGFRLAECSTIAANDRSQGPVYLVDEVTPSHADGTRSASKPPSEEKHGGFWEFMHHYGLVLTKHERADILRKGWGPESGIIVRDRDGTPINVDQLSDDEVIALDKELRDRPIGPPILGMATPIITQWGWQGSRQYRNAVSQLRQPGTH